MAEKRMFAKSIVLTDAFLDMPMSARCLYFTLGMLADDDGFVGSPKSVMRQCGASQDDLGMLLAKRFVLGFESGVIVIKHWRINNYLQNDRHHPTTYQEELSTLMLDQKGSYTEIESQLQEPMYTDCIQDVYIDKNSIEKNSKDKTSREKFVPPSQEEVQAYCDENGYNIDVEFFFRYYTASNWKRRDGTPVKNWKQTVVTWAKKDGENEKPKKRNQITTAAEYKAPNQTIDMSLLEKIKGAGL